MVLLRLIYNCYYFDYFHNPIFCYFKQPVISFM